MAMNICILGAGALGSAMGGVLREAGHHVVLVNRNQAHVDAINAQGLMLNAAGVDRIVHVQAVSDCAKVVLPKGGFELLIVLVKSFHTQVAMQAALPLVGDHTVVLSLQNGLGHEALLQDMVGAEKVLAGKTYAGGVMLAPGYVLDSTLGKETIVGELSGEVSARAQRIATVFSAAGLMTQVSPNIMTILWDKLLVNAATGPLSAITGLSYGPLYEQAELEITAIELVKEGMAVAKAAGVMISFTDARQPWLKAGTGLPRSFRPSMLQSLDKGSMTEIDYINGAIVRQGARLGIPTPVNAALVACIHGLESKLLKLDCVV
jgi:2-dehydropantoate 2-reductase